MAPGRGDVIRRLQPACSGGGTIVGSDPAAGQTRMGHLARATAQGGGMSTWHDILRIIVTRARPLLTSPVLPS
jgi:hypothetical protein